MSKNEPFCAILNNSKNRKKMILYIYEISYHN